MGLHPGRLANAVLNKAERGRAVKCASGPVEAIVHVSDRCTFRCAMCMNADQPVEWPAEGVHADSGDFDLAMLRELLSEWPTLKSVCFAGVGEPLLASDIREMVSFAHEQGLRTEIVTNATQVADHIEWLTSGVVDSISISLNAWNEESVSRYCGVGATTIERVKAGVRALMAAIEASNSPVQVEMSSVLWKSRRAEVPQILAFTAECGVKRLAFHNLIPSSLPGCGIEEVLGPQDADWVNELPAAGVPLGLDVTVPELLDPSSTEGHCESPWRVLYVDAAGGVSGCFRVEAPALEHGDWRSSDTWNNEYFQSLRRSHLRSSERSSLPDRCTTCVEVHGRAAR